MNSKVLIDDLDSDTSDSDYAPSDKAGSRSDSDVETAATSDTNQRKRKKLPDQSYSQKKSKTCGVEEKGSDGEEIKTSESDKQRIDDLWSDFLSDTHASEPPENKQPNFSKTLLVSTNYKAKTESMTLSKEEKTSEPANNIVFDFAGEDVVVPKDNIPSVPQKHSETDKNTDRKIILPKPKSGLVGALEAISKPKISTLEKSKLDWDGFKQKEGIKEELQTHNKGKDGYLERQDFLQRADVRQFYAEKDVRDKKRMKKQ